MTDTDSLDAAVRLALGLPEVADAVDAAFVPIEGRDSVGHLELMVGIEKASGIVIDAGRRVQDERLRVCPRDPPRPLRDRGRMSMTAEVPPASAAGGDGRLA
jgi:hypothetical protein